MGFYNLPDGSFYDPDGYLFNKEGFDEFGGHYDDDNIYIPGEKNEELLEDDNIDEDNYFVEFDDLANELERDDGGYVGPEATNKS